MYKSGIELDTETKIRLQTALKKMYFPLKIFGGWCFFMALYGIIGFFAVFISGEYNDLASLSAIYFTGTFMIMFLMLFMAVAVKMLNYSAKFVSDIDDNNFTWRVGTVTKKSLPRPKGSRYRQGYHSSSIYVDGECCTSISRQDYAQAEIGSIYIVIYMKNKSNMKFAMQL